jgi:hypothetical protein
MSQQPKPGTSGTQKHVHDLEDESPPKKAKIIRPQQHYFYVIGDSNTRFDFPEKEHIR